MKKKLLLLFALVATAIGVQAYDSDGINYTLVNYAFEVASGDYTGDIVIPERVKVGDSYRTVVGIGEGAFKNCKGVTSVTLPSSLQYIGNDAFNCSNLGLITCLNPEPPAVVGSSTFGRVDKDNCVLMVPQGARSAYAAADGWSAFSRIQEIGGSELQAITNVELTVENYEEVLDVRKTEGEVHEDIGLSRTALKVTSPTEGVKIKYNVCQGLLYWNTYDNDWWGVGDGTNQVSRYKTYALKLALYSEDGYEYLDNVKVTVNGVRMDSHNFKVQHFSDGTTDLCIYYELPFWDADTVSHSQETLTAGTTMLCNLNPMNGKLSIDLAEAGISTVKYARLMKVNYGEDDTCVALLNEANGWDTSVMGTDLATGEEVFVGSAEIYTENGKCRFIMKENDNNWVEYRLELLGMDATGALTKHTWPIFYSYNSWDPVAMMKPVDIVTAAEGRACYKYINIKEACDWLPYNVSVSNSYFLNGTTAPDYYQTRYAYDSETRSDNWYPEGVGTNMRFLLEKTESLSEFESVAVIFRGYEGFDAPARYLIVPSGNGQLVYPLNFRILAYNQKVETVEDLEHQATRYNSAFYIKSGDYAIDNKGLDTAPYQMVANNNSYSDNYIPLSSAASPYFWAYKTDGFDAKAGQKFSLVKMDDEYFLCLGDDTNPRTANALAVRAVPYKDEYGNTQVAYILKDNELAGTLNPQDTENYFLRVRKESKGFVVYGRPSYWDDNEGVNWSNDVFLNIDENGAKMSTERQYLDFYTLDLEEEAADVHISVSEGQTTTTQNIDNTTDATDPSQIDIQATGEIVDYDKSKIQVEMTYTEEDGTHQPGDKVTITDFVVDYKTLGQLKSDSTLTIKLPTATLLAITKPVHITIFGDKGAIRFKGKAPSKAPAISRASANPAIESKPFGRTFVVDPTLTPTDSKLKLRTYTLKPHDDLQPFIPSVDGVKKGDADYIDGKGLDASSASQLSFYAVTDFERGKITMKRVKGLLDDEAYILVGKPYFPVEIKIVEEDDDKTESSDVDNLLHHGKKGETINVPAGQYCYIYKTKDDTAPATRAAGTAEFKPGFYRAENTAFIPKEDIIYILTDEDISTADDAVADLNLTDGKSVTPIATAIRGTFSEVDADTIICTGIYNLAGQQVDENAKGVVIRNGKKVVVK